MNLGLLDKFVHLQSPIHALPPRLKLGAVLTILVFILILIPFFTAATAIQIMIFLSGVMAMITWLSQVPLRYLLMRSSLILPFSGFVILVNTISGSMDPIHIVLLLMRSLLSVFLILLFISTTPFHQILKQLSRWRFPKLLILVIAFMVRYFFVLAAEIESLEKGVTMRHSQISGWHKISTYSNILGMLLVRSYERAERVHHAMEMRGFTGEEIK
jgi:cobalt/nickel transport system permease protein